jgi:cell division septum initiation protein DivIVA
MSADMSEGMRVIDATPPAGIPMSSGFEFVKRGYDPVQVKRFANAVSAELQRLVEQNRQLKTALADTKEQSAPVDEQSVAKFLGSETSRLLELARSTSAQVVSRSEAKANALLAEARAQAAIITRDATAEAAKIRSDATEESRAAKAQTTAARRQMLGELADRRDLANAQILELANGCDLVTQRLTEVEEMTRYLLSKVAPIQAQPTDFVNLDPDRADGTIMVDTDAVLRLAVNGRK